MNDTTVDLRDLVDSLIDAREGEEHIDPAAIAAAAAAQLGESELRRVADLYIRGLARAACRKRFGRGGDDESDGPDLQGEMFPAESFRGLQRRYPAVRAEGREASYVLRDSMTTADVEFNLARLRREAGAKSAHADVLERWWLTRRASSVSPAA